MTYALQRICRIAETLPLAVRLHLTYVVMAQVAEEYAGQVTAPDRELSDEWIADRLTAGAVHNHERAVYNGKVSGPKRWHKARKLEDA